MNGLPMDILSREEQQRLMSKLYVLLGKQVKSYHKHRHMGDNTSVPVELAQELMESIEYTAAQAGGFHSGVGVEETLRAGQAVLSSRVQAAKSLLELVTATAPGWQTECRWETLRCLGRYLETYDALHLAHRTPEELFYPILVPVPEGIRGINCALFYLRALWQENQIMAAFSEDELEALWNRIHPDTLNQCEPLLLNALGKALISDGLCSPVFSGEERERVASVLAGGEGEADWNGGARRLRGWLSLSDGEYICTAAQQLFPRVQGALVHGSLAAVFL